MVLGSGPLDSAMSTVDPYGAWVASSLLLYDQLMTCPVGTVVL
jgi:hypothetical protein